MIIETDQLNVISSGPKEHNNITCKGDQKTMDGRNRHFSYSSPEQDGCRQPFTIKQEEIDSDSNLEWVTGNRSEAFFNDADPGVKGAGRVVKKEDDFGPDKLTGSGAEFPKTSSLSKDFGYIRACLGVVLDVDDKQRHELIQAMSSRLKYIEALTTGKNVSKEVVVKSESGGSSRERVARPCDFLSLDDYRPTSVVKQDSNPGSQDSDGTGEGRSSSEHEEIDELDDLERTMSKQARSSSKPGDSEPGLVTDIGKGRVRCNVCDRVITNPRRICTACSSYVSRMRMKCKESGLPLPSCHHKNFSGGASCQSCRLRKYVMMSKRLQPTPTRSRWAVRRSPKPQRKRRSGMKKRKRPEPQMCEICENTTPWFKGWRCSACFMFHARLLERSQAGEDIPSCVHDGSFAGVGCKGCRFKRLQEAAARHEPKLASRPKSGNRNPSPTEDDEARSDDGSVTNDD